jgi:hypothetical protein
VISRGDGHQELGAFFYDPSLALRIFKHLLPNASARLELNQPLISGLQLLHGFREKGGFASDELALVAADIFLTAIEPFGLVTYIKPVHTFEVRAKFWPTEADLVEDVRAQEIELILETTKVQVDIAKIKRISFALIDQLITPKLQQLGYALMHVSDVNGYLADVLTIVHARLTRNAADSVPDYLLENADIEYLAGNFSIIQMLSHRTSIMLLNPVFRLESVIIPKIATSIRSSRRWEVLSLGEATSCFGHEVIADARGKRVGVLTALHIVGQTRTQATHFITQSVPEGPTPLVAQRPLPALEAAIDSVLGSTFTHFTTERLFRQMVSAFSQLGELDGPYVNGLMMSEEDLEYYAAAISGSMGSLILGIEPDTNHFNIIYPFLYGGKYVDLTTTIAANGSGLTRDPGELLLMTEEARVGKPITSVVQTIPDDIRPQLLSEAPEFMLESLNRKILFQLDIFGDVKETRFSLAEILGQSIITPIQITVPFVNKAIIRAYLDGLATVRSLSSLADENELVTRSFQAMLGMIIDAPLSALYNTSKGRELSRYALERMMVDSTPAERKNVRSAFAQQITRLEAQLKIILLMMIKAGYMDVADYGNIKEIYEESGMVHMLATSLTIDVARSY